MRLKRYYGDVLRTRGGGIRTRVKEVRGSEVMRLLGNKANSHNRMKKNRLFGLMFVLKQSISMLEDLENLESLEIKVS